MPGGFLNEPQNVAEKAGKVKLDEGSPSLSCFSSTV